MNRLFSFFISIFFFSATAVFSQTLSKEAEARLLSFCELYSTVMYYYPEPNLQDFPWDAFAYQGYEMAITSESDEEFIQKTDSLFRIIAPGVQISRKEFDLSRITPKDTSLYPERAFWQHRGGLNVRKPTFQAAATLNYIYKKPTNRYTAIYTLPSKKLQGKKVRISLWAKVENQKDSTRILSYKFSNRKTKEIAFVEIKAIGNKWKRYEKEFKHAEEGTFPFDLIYLLHPKGGTNYVDKLKIEVKNGTKWEDIEIRNANFENYSSLGHLGGWESMYALSPLSFADSANAMEGKYCLKLPTVQDSLLYAPAPINQPYMISLPDGYKAYVPLQLYADEKTVFPTNDEQEIEAFTTTLQRDTLNANRKAIACAMQIWAALYQDYPYREADFEDKINRLLLQTIRKLDAAETANLILEQDFLQWLNDPHLRLEDQSSARDTTGRKVVNIPIKHPGAIQISENQCIVANVIDSAGDLQRGDVIIQINDIRIDSLLQLYKTHNISKIIQDRELKKLMVSYGKPEMKVRLLRHDAIVDVVFSTDTRKKGYGMMLKEYRNKCQALQDSVKATTGLFYLNAMYPPDAFSRSIVKDSIKALNKYRVTDSLIKEMNQYKALILDVRGRPESAILSFFQECMGVDLNRDADVVKTVFSPVAQFKRDTVRLTTLGKRKRALIQVPIYVLIDYHTVSAPERALISLKESKRATFIGSNTAGAAGFICKTKIADDISLVYTAGQVVGLDDNPMSYQGVGIPPDIYVYPTAQGIAEGRDEVLEKAIEAALDNLQEGKNE